MTPPFRYTEGGDLRRTAATLMPFFIVLAVVLLGWLSGTYQGLIPPALLLLSGSLAAGYILWKFAADLLPRTLEIDEVGIRYYAGGRKKWDLLWTEIEEMETVLIPVGIRGPVQGFTITAGGRKHSVYAGIDFNSPEKLEEAFRTAVHRAMECTDVRVKDALGWAGDIVEVADVRLKTGGFEGKWYRSASPLKTILLPVWGGALACVAVGSLLMYLLLTGVIPLNATTLLLPVGVAGMGLSFALALNTHIGRAYIARLMFDRSGVRFVTAGGAEVHLRWSDIAAVRADEEKGILNIRRGDGAWFFGYFSPELCRAVQTAHRSAEKDLQNNDGKPRE